MKARIKATGENIEVMYSHTIHDNGYDILWYKTLQGDYFTKEELKFITTEDDLDYWTRLEHQYAGMAMQGILADSDLLMSLINKKADDYPVKYIVAEFAKDCAHALVENYKKEEQL